MLYLECYDLNDGGASYRGKVAQTKSGYKCQAWSSQSLHEHTRFAATDLIARTLLRIYIIDT